MANLPFDRVRDTSTTTGTGTITVSGTPPLTYRTLSTVYAVNDKFDVVIVHRSLDEWEVCEATYSAANQFTRGRVYSSSNAGSAVNFSAGSKDIVVIGPAVRAGREKLTANRTYYVRTDGSDSNNGLADSAGGAFLTWQAAYDHISRTLDFAGYTVTLQCGGAGSRTFAPGSGVILHVDKGWVGGGALSVLGNTTTPSEVIMSATGADAFKTSGGLPGALTIAGFDIRTTTSGNGINHFAPGILYIGNNIYGACASNHIQVYGIGRYAEVTSAYTINGNASLHVYCAALAYIYVGGVTVTITGARTFTRFVHALDNSMIEGANTWNVGVSVAGQRYLVEDGSVIETYGAGTSHFPGNSAGAGTDFSASPWGLYQ